MTEGGNWRLNSRFLWCLLCLPFFVIFFLFLFYLFIFVIKNTWTLLLLVILNPTFWWGAWDASCVFQKAERLEEMRNCFCLIWFICVCCIWVIHKVYIWKKGEWWLDLSGMLGLVGTILFTIFVKAALRFGAISTSKYVFK